MKGHFSMFGKCLLRHVTSTRAETRMTLRPPADHNCGQPKGPFEYYVWTEGWVAVSENGIFP